MKTIRSALVLCMRRVGFVAAVAALTSLVACERGASDAQSARPDANTSKRAPANPSGEAVRETASPQATASRSADFQTLVGRWVRMDTPYVIEIRGASDDGTLEASYYNPRSINVSRAEARDKKGGLEVFVELRDVNYSGSNYTLIYDRAKNLLRGVYYQASLRQNYNVAFRRLRPGR